MFSQIFNYIAPITTVSRVEPMLNFEWLKENPIRINDLKMDNIFTCKESSFYCIMENFQKLDSLQNQPEKFNWNYLSSKSNLVPFLLNNFKYIDWNSFSRNPNWMALHKMRVHTEKINWYMLLLNQNPNSILMFDEFKPERRDYSNPLIYDFQNILRYIHPTYQYIGSYIINIEPYSKN
jgi:hypothetical protein